MLEIVAFLAAACRVTSALATSTQQEGMFDLRSFEAMMDEWKQQFRTSNASGMYADIRKQTSPTAYGSTDVVYLEYVLGRLDDYSAVEKQAWAEVINSFQDEQTGLYHYVRSYGLQPYHSTGAAVMALQLLGHRPRFQIKNFTDMVDAGPESWKAFLSKWTLEAKDLWSASHAISAVVGSFLLEAQQEAFTSFAFSFLDNISSATDGFFKSNYDHSKLHRMAGAFHEFRLYNCAGRPWPHAQQCVDHALALQHKNGLWGNAPAFCRDFDGIFVAARSSLLTSSGAYRWSDVKSACQSFLNTTHAFLTNKSVVFGRDYSHNSHELHGALYGIAECERHFPGSIQTSRPWRVLAGCIYRTQTQLV
jgi:hypothetical protein